jgi:hypothetical protein
MVVPSFLSVLIVGLTSNFFGRCFLGVCFGGIACVAIRLLCDPDSPVTWCLYGWACIPLIMGLVYGIGIAVFGGEP